ncbi:MAG: hypothetical protein IKT41_01815 [Clostridia bacterium]|nr:hypothetical protein [Clostridia bacterium]
MNVINFEKVKKEKQLNKRKVIWTAIIMFSLITFAILFSLYVGNENIRVFFDKYIFRKEINENKSNIIELTGEEQSIYAYNNKIVILNKNNLYTYNQSGKQESELEINISTPIFASSNRFLAVAEKKGKKICLVSENNIVWQKEVSGNVSKLYVNKNGYVSAVVLDTSYKNIIITFDETGKELFTTYLPTTNVIDVSISNDNKYLAFAEIDTTGTLIESKVRIISIENAKTDSKNSFDYIYEAESGKLITNIRYQDKNNLVCMYDNDIEILKNKEATSITQLNSNEISFVTIELDNHIAKIQEKSTGVFTADTQISFIDIISKKQSVYTANGACKEIYSYGNIIALNMGAEVHFVSTNGWLAKKYISTQEVKDVVIGNGIAGIVYKNKIEIINL